MKRGAEDTWFSNRILSERSTPIECGRSIGKWWMQSRHREQARSHSWPGLYSIPAFHTKPCGSGLARESGRPANIHVECETAIASRLASTVGRGCTQYLRSTHNPVGAGLLAKAVDQPTSMLNVKPPSRAGSLPQLAGVVLNTCGPHTTLWERACPRKRSTSQHPC